MALDMSILELKAPKMAEDIKALKARCPKARSGMVADEDTGLAKMAHTNLVPIYFLQSIPERGWFAGEVCGVLPANAKQILAKEIGMELHGAYDSLPKNAADKAAAVAAAKSSLKDDDKKADKKAT